MVRMDPHGRRGQKLLTSLLQEMPRNHSNPSQEPAHPYALQVEVVEDRSVLMGFPDGYNGITGSQGTNHQLDKVPSDTKSFAVEFLFYFDFLIKTC